MGEYGIRSGYRPNPRRRAPDRDASPAYWTPDRVRKSLRHQVPVYRYARDLALRRGARRVLDVGCGVGTKLCRLFDERFEIFGVDRREAIDRCRELWPRGHWFVEDLEAPGPGLGQEAARGFDLIIASDVIEHLLDPDALLRYLRGLASDSTRIVLSTPERERLLGPDALDPSNPEHVREWSFAEFRRYVEGAGFEVLDHRCQLPHPLRPDALSLRFLRRQLGARRSLRTNQVLLCRIGEPQAPPRPDA